MKISLLRAAPFYFFLTPSILLAQADMYDKSKVSYELVDSITDPCNSPYGPNFITFINKGRNPGEATFIYGVNICTKEIFQYRTATRSTFITRFSANPVIKVEWSDPTSPLTNKRDSEIFDITGGIDFVFGAMTLPLGANYFREDNFSMGFSLGTRYDKLKLTGTRTVSPLGNALFGKLTITPFKKWGEVKDAVFARESWQEDKMRYFNSVPNLCNQKGVGFRGFDDLNLGEKVRRDTASILMVSFCTKPYRVYKVKFFIKDPHFKEFNNTYPKFADWGRSPGDGFFSNLGFSAGVGKTHPSFAEKVYNVKVLYLGLDFVVGDSRWWVSFGKLFPLTKSYITILDNPQRIFFDAWVFGFQRSLKK